MTITVKMSVLTFYSNLSIIVFMKTLAKNEKIIDAAKSVFLKYGYKRVTMSDIADAADISRPAIYLMFPNKEEIFKAVCQQIAKKNLDEIYSGYTKFTTPLAQLKYVFEIWTIKPFELVSKSPEAKELMYSGHALAKEIYQQIGLEFEELLILILKSVFRSKSRDYPSPASIASILRNAIRGFKESARDVLELRQMIDDLLLIVFS